MLNRTDIARIVGNDPKLIAGFEQVQRQASDATDAVEANVAATQGIGNATVIVLSPNDAFENEYVLAVSGLTLDAQNGKVVIGLPFELNGPGRLVLNQRADTFLTLPTAGTLATTSPPGPFADDAAAAAGGVAVGEAYRSTITVGTATRGIIAWRQT